MGTTVACTGPTKHQNSEYCNSEHLGSARNNAGYFVWNNNMYCNIFFRPLHIMKTHFGMTCSLTSLPISSRNRMRKHGNTNLSSVVSGDSLLLCSWDGPAVWSMDSTSVETGISLVIVSMSEGGSPTSKLFMWAPLQYLRIPDKHDMIFKSVTSYK